MIGFYFALNLKDYEVQRIKKNILYYNKKNKKKYFNYFGFLGNPEA